MATIGCHFHPGPPEGTTWSFVWSFLRPRGSVEVFYSVKFSHVISLSLILSQQDYGSLHHTSNKRSTGACSRWTERDSGKTFLLMLSGLLTLNWGQILNQSSSCMSYITLDHVHKHTALLHDVNCTPASQSLPPYYLRCCDFFIFQ